MDICYGPNSSIYDVLQVHQDASPKEIQGAFMARRLELYHKMQSINEQTPDRTVTGPNGVKMIISERNFIENQMDVLAGAFKVLRDPRKRRKYDAKFKRIAPTMTSTSAKKVHVGKKATGEMRGGSPTSIMEGPVIGPSLTNDLDDIQLSKSDGEKENGVTMEFMTPVKTERRSHKLKDSPSLSPSTISAGSNTKSVRSSKSNISNKSSKANKSVKSKKSKDKKVPIKSDPSLDEREECDCDESVENFYRNQDVVQTRETGLGSWLRKNEYTSQADAVDTVATEIKGSVADICLSFSQVMTAFSVDEEAIDAMARNIGDTSKQLEAGKYR